MLTKLKVCLLLFTFGCFGRRNRDNHYVSIDAKKQMSTSLHPRRFSSWLNLLSKSKRSRIIQKLVMLRQGRTDGWLQQVSPKDLTVWAKWNQVRFNALEIGSKDGRGRALVATDTIDPHVSKPLLKIPRALILSLDRILEHAKSDRDFTEILGCLGSAVGLQCSTIAAATKADD